MLFTIPLMIARTLIFLGGVALVLVALESIIHTLIVPRAINTPLVRWYYDVLGKIFRLRLKFARNSTFELRDRVMSMYAPMALFLLPFVWLTLVLLGYTLIFYGLNYSDSIWDDFVISGSSLLTLGTIVFPDQQPVVTVFMFTEAAIGMVLVALLISYLPTMYSAFAERERAVIQLTTPAGSPPSPVTMLTRLHRIGNFEENMGNTWLEWRDWFTSIDESHTTYAPLVFFRSSKPSQSWITSAGVVLDTAALTNAAIDIPHDPRADLTIRAGYVALRNIADFFQLAYNPKPHPDDPISIAKEEFMAVLDDLEAAGIPLKADREQAWKDFAGWRVNYDMVLLRIAELTMAPYAMWVSDRSIPRMPRRFDRHNNGTGQGKRPSGDRHVEDIMKR
ncbi:MAG: hypothetical protein AAF653_05235 [Chloroflexota bacterium]